MMEPTNTPPDLTNQPQTSQTNTSVTPPNPNTPTIPGVPASGAAEASNPAAENTNPNYPTSKDTRKLSGLGRKLLKDIEFDKDEEFVCEIRKHPFGLVIIYVVGTVIAGGMLLATLAAGLYLRGDPLGNGLDLANFRGVFLSIGFLLTVVAAVMTAIEAYLYRNNILIVSSEKLSQMLYRTIFDRKVSQLSIGHVQDVTVKQIGIPARLFNYGTLVIETAGEQDNYIFTYAPFPFECSKEIVGAHERNLQKYGN